MVFGGRKWEVVIENFPGRNRACVKRVGSGKTRLVESLALKHWDVHVAAELCRSLQGLHPLHLPY